MKIRRWQARQNSFLSSKHIICRMNQVLHNYQVYNAGGIRVAQTYKAPE